MEDTSRFGIEYAREMDARDVLGRFRERFYLGADELYFDGNSLGVCSKDAEASLLHMLEVWKKDKILM